LALFCFILTLVLKILAVLQIYRLSSCLMRIRERLRGSHIDDGTEKGENLIRFPLTAAQEAAAIFRRKALYETLHPETKHGANQHTAGVADSATPRFTANTAQSTGKSERSVQVAAARGESISEQALKLVTGTKLDKGVYLDRLKEVEPQKQPERVKAGERVTAMRLSSAQS
jgi:hypothetical protein